MGSVARRWGATIGALAIALSPNTRAHATTYPEYTYGTELIQNEPNVAHLNVYLHYDAGYFHRRAQLSANPVRIEAFVFGQLGTEIDSVLPVASDLSVSDQVADLPLTVRTKTSGSFLVSVRSIVWVNDVPVYLSSYAIYLRSDDGTISLIDRTQYMQHMRQVPVGSIGIDPPANPIWCGVNIRCDEL